MIDITLLPLFFTAAFFLVIAPGPDLLLVSTYASSKGMKAGIMIALGIFSSGVIQTCLVAFGLGQLMQAMPVFALIIKVIGALYLSYLGLKLLRQWWQTEQLVSAPVEAHSEAMLSLFYKGCLGNLLNPKALVFFSLFLPQFTNANMPITPQILMLGAILSILALLVNTVIAYLFYRVSAKIKGKTSFTKHIDGILGGIFLALAARLLVSPTHSQ